MATNAVSLILVGIVALAAKPSIGLSFTVDVCSLGNCLKMLRIDTPLIPAQMVNDQLTRITLQHRIGQSMREAGESAIEAGGKAAVAVAGYRSGPFPTLIGPSNVHLGPEQFFGCPQGRIP